MESYKDAYNYALQSISYADQASLKEAEYQQQKQQTFIVIGTAREKIIQIKDAESSDAKQLLQKAKDELKSAEDAYNQKNIESCKTAYSSALQSISYADQASTKEQEYQQERQKAFDLMETAEEKIIQVKHLESPDAKQLLQQAQNQLTDAKNVYDQKTIESCKNAYSNAQQSIAYAEQASAKEQTYQQDKQRQQLQQSILIVGGILAIVIVAIVAIVFMRKKR